MRIIESARKINGFCSGRDSKKRSVARIYVICSLAIISHKCNFCNDRSMSSEFRQHLPMLSRPLRTFFFGFILRFTVNTFRIPQATGVVCVLSPHLLMQIFSTIKWSASFSFLLFCFLLLLLQSTPDFVYISNSTFMFSFI